MTQYYFYEGATREVTPLTCNRLHSAILEAQLVHEVRRVAYGYEEGKDCIIDRRDIA